MAKELAKSYNPSEFEDRIYDFWLKGNYFHAEVDKDKKPFSIPMHALRILLCRYPL